MSQEGVIKRFLEGLITPRFLSLVEKWARYEGETFYVGDIDITVENMGTFVKKTELPKWKTIDGKFTSVKGETETHETFYDVTKIKNNCTCSEYDTRILVAERRNKHSSRPPRVYIYAVFRADGSKRPSNSQYTHFPSFRRLKKDFESETFMHHNSMLSEFCDVYSLSPFNEETDRIFNFTGIEMDLECIETNVEEFPEEVPPEAVTLPLVEWGRNCHDLDRDTKYLGEFTVQNLEIEELERYLDFAKEKRGCICENRQAQHKTKDDVWICGDCDLPIKAQKPKQKPSPSEVQEDIISKLETAEEKLKETVKTTVVPKETKEGLIGMIDDFLEDIEE